MRVVCNVVLVAALCTPLFSACAAPWAMAASREGAPCPEQEGYPDCQDGHRVDLAHLADYDYERARIQDLQARSELALDSGDAGAYASLFVEDGELDGPEDVAKGRAAIRNAILDMQKSGAQPTAQAVTPSPRGEDTPRHHERRSKDRRRPARPVPRTGSRSAIRIRPTARRSVPSVATRINTSSVTAVGFSVSGRFWTRQIHERAPVEVTAVVLSL